MKSKYMIMATALLTPFLLAGCCDWCENKCPETNNDSGGPWQGDPNSRTWVVSGTVEPDKHHLSYGDAFKIMKVGEEIRLKPLTGLRNRWGIKNPNYTVLLDQLEGGDLCGNVEIKNHAADEHTWHVLLISQESEGLKVEYEIVNDDKETLCTRRGTHGGVAHVEN